MDESLFEISIDRMKELKLEVLYKWYDCQYSYTSFPKEHQRKVHTNSITERFNRELKRKTRKRCIS